MIKFNENAWLKPYLDMNNMNTDQEKKQKIILKKIFFRLNKLMNNAVFWKIMENVRQNRDI